MSINEEHPLYVARHAQWSESKDLYRAALLPGEPPQCVADCEATEFHQFTTNCDLKGTSLQEFFNQRLLEALVCGSSYVVVNFAGRGGQESRPYLVGYWPDEVTNWKCDAEGKLEWVVIRTSSPQDSGVSETLWTRYGREEFQTYRRVGEDDPIELIGQGRHGLEQVPVFRLQPHAGAVERTIQRILDAVGAVRLAGV